MKEPGAEVGAIMEKDGTRGYLGVRIGGGLVGARTAETAIVGAAAWWLVLGLRCLGPITLVNYGLIKMN